LLFHNHFSFSLRALCGLFIIFFLQVELYLLLFGLLVSILFLNLFITSKLLLFALLLNDVIFLILLRHHPLQAHVPISLLLLEGIGAHALVQMRMGLGIVLILLNQTLFILFFLLFVFFINLH
jgi:hypothetical protein